MNTTRFVICIDDSHYPASLELHKVYRVIPDEDAERDGDLRIIDESGEDYLYPADYFLPIDLPHHVLSTLDKSFAQHTGNRLTNQSS
ncbi:MAG: hypothetical protein WCA08_12900 [Desulfoferrobacter sp.]